MSSAVIFFLRGMCRDRDCWSGWSHSPYLWLVTGPMLAAYLVGGPFEKLLSLHCFNFSSVPDSLITKLNVR
jgi:hypothetical protein